MDRILKASAGITWYEPRRNRARNHRRNGAEQSTKRMAAWFCLCLLAGALGYAVLEHGARKLLQWNISLLIIGVTSLGYWVTTPSRRLAPAMERLPGL